MFARVYRGLSWRIRHGIERANHLPAQLRAGWVRRVVRGPVWYTDRDGITCELRPDDELQYYFERRSLFDDRSLLHLVRRCVKPGMTVFDVGAHWGVFSLYVARRLNGEGSLHLFEPTPGTFLRLQRNIQGSPGLAHLATLNNMAVTRSDGPVTFNIFPQGQSVWNSLGCPTMHRDDGTLARPVASVVTEGITVDSYCTAKGIQRVDLMKVDVEGFEDDVIAGCERLLSRGALDRVIFEISLEPLQGASKTARDILASFADRGLLVSRITEDGNLVPVGDPAAYEAPFFANYFAVPRGRPDLMPPELSAVP